MIVVLARYAVPYTALLSCVSLTRTVSCRSGVDITFHLTDVDGPCPVTGTWKKVTRGDRRELNTYIYMTTTIAHTATTGNFLTPEHAIPHQ